MAVSADVFKKLTVRCGLPAHLREVALVAGAYFVYMFVRRVIVPGAEDIGLNHADKVIAFERSAGIFWEPKLQAAALDAGRGVLVLFNYLYIFTYFPVVMTTAIIFYIFNRQRYYYYRRLILLSFGAALIIFIIFPLAPPRFAGTEGVFDSIVRFGPPWYGSRESGAYYNAYAAMPSLHFAWTLTFGVLFWNTGPRALKVLGVLYPTMAFFAIVITGNHYIMDAVIGAFMMLVVLAVYHLIIKPGHLARLVPDRVARVFRDSR